MVETLNHNDFENESMIHSEWNANSFEFRTSLSESQKDEWVERKPDTNEGKKVFDYTDKNWWKWEIVIGKNWDNQYEIRVKKWQKIQETWQWGWKTQKYEQSLIAGTESEFNNKLWAILDETIWTVGSGRRINLQNTWKEVFSLLNNPQSGEQPVWNRENVETQDMPKWLTLDHGTYIYEVQSGDCESTIKRKLEKYGPLSYLKGVPNGINWYNFNSIPDNELLPWLKITIPKPDSERIKTVSDFIWQQKLALNAMKNNATYWEDVKALINTYWEDYVAKVMAAYARTETSPDNYDWNIWNLALFRYEANHKCPSYWYHHVLYERAGKTAFKNTWLTIWQSCNPKESWELFLAFCIEKANGAQRQENKDFKKFFDMTNTRRCAKFYNWVDIDGYSTKLKNNFDSINK